MIWFRRIFWLFSVLYNPTLLGCKIQISPQTAGSADQTLLRRNASGRGAHSFILLFVLLLLSLVQPFWGGSQVGSHLFIYPSIHSFIHIFIILSTTVLRSASGCNSFIHSSFHFPFILLWWPILQSDFPQNLIIYYCSLWCQLLQNFFYLILSRSMGSGRTRPMQIAKIIYNLQKLKTNFSQMLFSMMLVITGRARAESQTWSIFLINQTILR